MKDPHELRYRGELLGTHPTRAAAEEHAREHHGLRPEGAPRQHDHHVLDPENLTIERARPVELRCRGNLVDTFRTVEGAHAAISKLATKRAPAEVWTVHDRSEDPTARESPAAKADEP